MAHLFIELQYGNNPPDLKQYISLNNEANLSLLTSASISTSSVGFVMSLIGTGSVVTIPSKVAQLLRAKVRDGPESVNLSLYQRLLCMACQVHSIAACQL